MNCKAKCDSLWKARNALLPYVSALNNSLGADIRNEVLAQQQENFEAVRATAQEQVPFNIQKVCAYVDSAT